MGQFRVGWLLILFAACAVHGMAEDVVTPNSCAVDGGVRVDFERFYSDTVTIDYTAAVYFGEVPATDAHYEVQTVSGGDEIGFFHLAHIVCTVPAQTAPGSVDVSIDQTPLHDTSPAIPRKVYANAFTYLQGPELTSIHPSQHSILPDDVPVTITGRGFSVAGGVKVAFGGRPATDVSVDATGTQVICIPPPFIMGAAFPITVDVEVVNPDRGSGVLPDTYVYELVTPVIISQVHSIPAWTSGVQVSISIDRIVSGPVAAYFDGVTANASVEISNGQPYLYCFAPAHAPGYVPVTVVNGDGGVYIKSDAMVYVGTQSTDFHSSDLNQNFRIEMSELLRAIQFFNVGEFHCDASTEDGYAPRPGEQGCAAYASDHDPQDWKIELSEVLELVQFYNLYCYQPCAGAPGTYCPPN